MTIETKPLRGAMLAVLAVAWVFVGGSPALAQEGPPEIPVEDVGEEADGESGAVVPEPTQDTPRQKPLAPVPPRHAVLREGAPRLDLPREHDRFFLRLAGGPSIDGVLGRNAPASVGRVGGAGNLLVSVGGCPVKNLVLTSEFGIGLGGLSSSSSMDATYLRFQVGGALYYYFMPVNVFIGGGAGYGFATAGQHQGFSIWSDEPDPPAYMNGSAVSAHLDVGKEWWVSDRWGVGLGVRAQYSGVVDEKRGHIVSGMLYLSATYN